MFNNYNLISNDTFLGSNPEIPEFDYNSFYRAYVESIDDPDNLGRIKIRIPYLHANADVSQLPYAYPAVNVGFGNQVGQFILPPVGSIVFVTFEYSSEHRPIYFGGIPTRYAEGKEQYYGKRINNGESIGVTSDDIPIEYTGSQYIIYKSPSGSIIYIDDNDMGPQIVVKDSIGQELRFTSNSISEQDAKGAIILKHDKDNLIKIGKDSVVIRVAGVDYPVPWSTGEEGTSDFNLLINKPKLDTTSATSLPISSTEEIKDTIKLHKVSKTGNYSDLNGLPVIPEEQVNSDWNSTSGKSMILNKPTLSDVATSGEYSDLKNKPTIPTKTSDLTNDSNFIIKDDIPEQVNADWNSSSGTSQILNKPNLSKVATSGKYTDLSSRPTLNTTYSESLSTGANEVIDGNIHLHKISKTGSYNDLNDKPTIPEQVNADWNATEGKAQILNKPSLSTVATSGSYNDLKNKPTIPSKTSDLTNDSGFITESDIPEQVNADWSSNSGPSQILNKPDLSVYESKSNKVNVSSSSTADQYPNAKSVYDFVTSSLESLPQGLKIPVSIELESKLPAKAEDGDYYFIQNMDITAPDRTGRAWWNNGQWYKVFDQYQSMDGVSIVQSGGGSWQVSTEWLHGVLALSEVAKTGDYNDLLNKPSLSTVATSGSYNDLKNKPTIPTKTSQLTNDSNFITVEDIPDIPTQVNADWNATEGPSKILNKPNLSRVATSGSYNDLSNKPTIPSKVSQLSNDSGFITESDIPEQVNADWNSTSGKSQILNKPTLSTIAISGSYNDLKNKPTLSTVATSGDYNDLKNKPTYKTINNQSIIGTGNISITSDGAIYVEQSSSSPSTRIINIPGITSYTQLSGKTIKIKSIVVSDSSRPYLNINNLGKTPLRIPSSSASTMSQTFKANWVNKDQVYEVTYNSSLSTFDLLNSNLIDLASDNEAILGTNTTKPVTPKALKAVMESSNFIRSSDNSINNVITLTYSQYKELLDTNKLDENTYYNVLDDVIPASTSTPLGGIIFWPAALGKLQSNFMRLQGQTLNISDYPSLFNILGTTYGGDGKTTFKLPDASGMTLVGVSDTDTTFKTLGGKIGEKEHKLTLDELPRHQPQGLLNTKDSNTTGSAINWEVVSNGRFYGGDMFKTLGGDKAHNNIQPSLLGYWVMKVKEDCYTEDLLNLDKEIFNLKNSLSDIVKQAIKEDNMKKYYVGCLIMDTKNINPSTYLGFGTWTLWGSGRVPVGVDPSQTEFNTVEKTGGSKFLHAHSHAFSGSVSFSGEWHSYDYEGVSSGGIISESEANPSGPGLGGQGHDQTPWKLFRLNASPSFSGTTGVAGKGNAENLQPYITCYIWKRTK